MISTQVSDLVSVPSFVWSHRTVNVLFCKCAERCTSTKQDAGLNSCVQIQHQILWLWCCQVQPGIDSHMHMVIYLQWLNCPMKAHTSEDVYCMGCWAPLQHYLSENQKFIHVRLFFILITYDFVNTVKICKLYKVTSQRKSDSDASTCRSPSWCMTEAVRGGPLKGGLGIRGTVCLELLWIPRPFNINPIHLVNLDAIKLQLVHFQTMAITICFSANHTDLVYFVQCNAYLALNHITVSLLTVNVNEHYPITPQNKLALVKNRIEYKHLYIFFMLASNISQRGISKNQSTLQVVSNFTQLRWKGMRIVTLLSIFC